MLDAPMPLMGQLVEILKFTDTLVPDVGQVIEVRKIILQDGVPHRAALREPQLAEQLVDVPTILHFLKQKVDIPVPGARLRLRGDLPGFSLEEGFFALFSSPKKVRGSPGR